MVNVNEGAKLLYNTTYLLPQPLPLAPSSFASPSASAFITKLARPLVLYEHISSYYYYSSV